MRDQVVQWLQVGAPDLSPQEIDDLINTAREQIPSNRGKLVLLVGSALVLGVPLVVPLMLLPFVGAFFPIVGAIVSGLLAVLITLASGGLVAAFVVLGTILVVKEISGRILYPYVMGYIIPAAPLRHPRGAHRGCGAVGRRRRGPGGATCRRALGDR